MTAIRWRSDFDKHVLTVNCDKRGWQRTHSDDEWNVYWANVFSVKALFNPETTTQRLRDDQFVNHFPNHYELTRKDLMVKNIRRYRKDCDKESHIQYYNATANGSALPTAPLAPLHDFVPTTYLLPTDYSLFVEEFRKNPQTTWIMKPANKAQGRGIFLVSKLTQLRKWAAGGGGAAGASGTGTPKDKNPFQALQLREPYVISRYIERPLLIGGKKFDLRLFVLVTNFRPITAYLYEDGFCRFCHENYTSDITELDNLFVHLTNVAVQRRAEDYNEVHGNKWSIANLRLWLECTRGKERADRLFDEMKEIVIVSLKAVKPLMINDKHSFECYGYDILIDETLKPWLVEVNASPSLSTTTDEDRMVKLRLINDILDVVVPPNLAEVGSRVGTSWNDARQVGGFKKILDESPPTGGSFNRKPSEGALQPSRSRLQW